MKSRYVAEVFEKYSADSFKDIVKEAFDILEKVEDENVKEYAQAMLDISKMLLKVWRFYWPPRVEVELVFEDPRPAERVLEVLRRVLGRASKKYRKIDDRVYPAVVVDWRDWRKHVITSETASIIDIIVDKYLEQKSKKKAYRELAEDLYIVMEGIKV